MVAMPIPECDTLAIKTALLEQYRIEIPVHEWQGHYIVRLSCQGYNTQAQMDVLVDALGELLQLRRPAKKLSQGGMRAI
jgi:isopenicillin-N epimerase